MIHADSVLSLTSKETVQAPRITNFNLSNIPIKHFQKVDFKTNFF